MAGTVTVVTAPSHGTTSIDAVTGAITYTDDGTATTDDTFIYTVEDNLGALSNEATVTVSINSSENGNQTPVATNDSADSIDPSASVSVDVLSNDTDNDGTLVAGTVTVVTAPSHGSTSIDAVTGAITYTDDGAATTDDTFTYTVEDNLGALSNEATVTVSINSSNVGNQAPVATNDSAGPIDPNTSVLVDELSNDSDNDGTLVAGTVTVVTVPSHGTTSIDAVTGAITYTDDGTATTNDTFTYTVEDNLGALSNEATVTVSITHANGTCGMGLSLDGSDDWVNVPNLVLPGDFTIEAWVNLAPGISAADALIGQESAGPDINFFGGKARLYSATAPFDVVVADTTVQANTWTHVAISRSGTSLLLYLNGLLDGIGTWSGSLSVQALGRGNQSTLGYLEGELDEVRVWSVARSGSEINANYNQSVASGSPGLAAYWTFNESGQAVADESGSGNDGSLGNDTSVTSDDPSRIPSAAPINESCSGGEIGNQAPVATNDSAGFVDPSASVSVDVLSNDSDSDGTLVAGTVTVVTAPSHGTTSIDAVTGAITYTDDGTATTDDTFTYTVEDNLGALSNTATVTVISNSSRDADKQAPVANNDSAAPIDPNASVLIDVLSNDTDDGVLVAGTVTVVTAPSHGSTSIDTVSGAITYTDDGTTTTADIFTYTVEDDQGLSSNEATVTIPLTSSSWTVCALEGRYCSFVGTANVRFGANGKFTTLTATDGIYCSNSVFGDPAPGATKKCEIDIPLIVFPSNPNATNELVLSSTSSSIRECAGLPNGSTKPGDRTILTGCSGDASQHFELKAVGNGSSTLVSGHDSLCLTVEQSDRGVGDPVVQLPCDGSVNQNWTIQPFGSGGNQIISDYSNLCLSAQGSGQQLIQQSCGGLNTQIWEVSSPLPSKWTDPISTSVLPVAVANLPNGKVLS